MSLTREDVVKVAHLARLNIEEDQIDSLTKDLDNILSLVEKMNQTDTKNVSPLAHPLDEHQPLRPDQVTESDQRDLFQQIAPQTSAGLYIVPKVIESEG